jgi:hypothetical protein
MRKLLALFAFSSLCLVFIESAGAQSLSSCLISCEMSSDNSNGPSGGGGGGLALNLSKKSCKKKLLEREIQDLVHFCQNNPPANYTFQCQAQWGNELMERPSHSFHCDQ